jgi:ferredoxin
MPTGFPIGILRGEDSVGLTMPQVTFEPIHLTIEGAEGDSLFELAQRHGIPVATACVAQATCGLCRMKVIAGGENLTPFNAGERKHLGNVYFITKERLSCQARLLGGDVVVELRPLRVAPG